MEPTETVPVTIDKLLELAAEAERAAARLYAAALAIKQGNEDAIKALYVVPWGESKVGDVVEINGKMCRAIEVSVHSVGRCSKCCMKNLSCADELGNLMCETHPSGRHIYFTEVKE